MVKKVNIGVIGAGRISYIHCRNLRFNIPEANILMISDIKIQAAKKYADEFNISDITEDYRKIIENPGIDAVVICSSSDTHSFMIEEAAQAGKHIFCEKPIDLNLEKINRALKAVEKSGVKLQVGFNRRFDPNFQKARKIIQSGKIGELNILKITSRDPKPQSFEYLKTCGGIFFDMTIHDFDMARFLSRSEVEEVYVIGGVLVHPFFKECGDLDTAAITLKFKNGAIGVIDNCRRAVYGYDQRAEIFGSKGMINVGNKLIDTVELSDSKNTTKALLPYFFMERYGDSFINEMKEFVQCIIKDTSPSVTGIDGKMPVILAMASKLSYENNRPVKVSEV